MDLDIQILVIMDCAQILNITTQKRVIFKSFFVLLSPEHQINKWNKKIHLSLTFRH